MNTKLLKRIRKRFAWIYDDDKREWIVVDRRQPFFFIKPLKDYSYAECMYGIVSGLGMVNHRRTIKAINRVFTEILLFKNHMSEI